MLIANLAIAIIGAAICILSACSPPIHAFLASAFINIANQTRATIRAPTASVHFFHAGQSAITFTARTRATITIRGTHIIF